MSTRSAIIVKVGKTYKGIYCHNDGYIQDVGKMLQEHYTDPKKIKALIALSDISILNEEVAPPDGSHHSWEDKQEKVTVAYHRDRGDEYYPPQTGKTSQEVANKIDHNNYVYVFQCGIWTVNGKPLAAAIINGDD